MTDPSPSELLPHAPPFLFLDEILEVQPTSLRAVRTFRPEEDFFRGHFPQRPIVPGVLLVEAMAQAFAYLMIHHHQEKGVFLTGIDRARFRRPVLPGDRVVFTVEVEGQRLGLVQCRAEARVGEHKVADARLSGRGMEAAP